jgi:hypothetical protein
VTQNTEIDGQLPMGFGSQIVHTGRARTLLVSRTVSVEAINPVDVRERVLVGRLGDGPTSSSSRPARRSRLTSTSV